MKVFFRSFCCVLFLFSLTFSESPYAAKIEKLGGEKDDILFVAWNAENFGRKKTQEAIDYMAQVLRNADIVQLEEISTSNFGAQAVAKLADDLNRTGAKWDYAVTPSTHDCSSKECYAFLWKTSRVKLASSAKVASELSSGLEREPGEITFIIDFQSLLVAAIHLSPTAKDPKTESDFLSYHASDFIAKDFLISGDFNLSHEQIGTYFESLLNVEHCIEGKTSIKNKYGANGQYLLNEYDNIYVRGVKVERAGIMDFFPAYKDFKAAKKISDHLPVYIVFKF